MSQRLHVVTVNLRERFAVLSNGETCAVTNCFVGEREVDPDEVEYRSITSVVAEQAGRGFWIVDMSYFDPVTMH